MSKMGMEKSLLSLESCITSFRKLEDRKAIKELIAFIDSLEEILKENSFVLNVQTILGSLEGAMKELQFCLRQYDTLSCLRILEEDIYPMIQRGCEYNDTAE